MFNFIITLALIMLIVFITALIFANLIDTAEDMWFDAICLAEGYDTLINTGKRVVDQDNLRQNRFLHQKGCLCSPQDKASLKAAFHNEKQAA